MATRLDPPSQPPLPLSLRAYRLWMRGLAAVAPVAAEREVIRRFATPRRLRRTDVPPVDSVARRRATVEVNGHRLAVYAEGAGPTVLFAHGWEGSAGDLAPIAGALLRAGFRVVLFDMPAHGRSSGRLTTLPEMARAVRAVGEQCAPVHAVVGHSLGGTAATLALRDGLAAARAVVIGAPAEPTVYLERLARLLALPEPRVAGVVERVRALAGGDFSLVDASVAVRGLAVPGLVIHDAYDREVPCDDGRAVAAAWPSCRLVVTEGLGHRRLLAAPTVVEAIVSFVTEPSTLRI